MKNISGFSVSDYPIEIYQACSQILKQTDAFLSEHADALSATDKNNMKFYIAMAVCPEALKKSDPSVAEIASLAQSALSPAALEAAYQLVKNEYQTLGATDQVAKGAELVEAVKKRIIEKFSPLFHE